MTKTNIFKMELYRNLNDRAYIIVISVLTGLFTLATALGVPLLKGAGGHEIQPLLYFEIPFLVALFIAFWAFAIIYPWHLLSTDYNNKVLSLVIASGVKRSNYYFIKIIATILTNMMAYFVIGILPVVILAGFFNAEFVSFVQTFIKGFTMAEGWIILLSLIFSSISSIVIFYFVVIFTKGKFWGIFVYFGISLGLGVVVSTINYSMAFVGTQTMSDSTPFFWLILV
ncbi:hypothetical protein [Lactococcus fujiensis]|uniref:hypothetical protein n=1 Tax=Lactococcus fujiensis TaxID=610251 RepID=UPI0006D10067|nr:hypothetical protein [Lactococcus fujiensis]